MTEAVTFDFEHANGDNVDLEVTVTSDGTTPKDLSLVIETIFTAKARTGNHADVVLSQTGGAISITDPVNGELTVSVPRNQLVTADQQITLWDYSVRVEEGANDTQTVVRGVIPVTSSPAAPS